MQVTGIRAKNGGKIENKEVCDTHCLSEVLTVCELIGKGEGKQGHRKQGHCSIANRWR